MKRLQKIIFALSAFTALMIGCKSPQDNLTNLPAVSLELKNVEVTAGGKSVTVNGPNKNEYTAEVTTKTVTVKVSAKVPAGVTVKIDNTQADMGKGNKVTFTDAEVTAKKKTVLITVENDKDSTQSVTYKLVLTYKGENPANPSETPAIELPVVTSSKGTFKVEAVGGAYTATVTEKTVSVKVTPRTNGTTVTLKCGTAEQKNSLDVTFDGAEKKKEVHIVVTHGKKSNTYTLTLTYDDTNTNVEKVEVTYTDTATSKPVTKNVQQQGSDYAATVLAKPATIKITPQVSTAKVLIKQNDGTFKAAENSDFIYTLQGADKQEKTFAIEHNGKTGEAFKVIIDYNTADYSITDITIMDAAGGVVKAARDETGKAFSADIKTKTISSKKPSFKVTPAAANAKIFVTEKGAEKLLNSGDMYPIDFGQGNAVTYTITVDIKGHKKTYALNISYRAPALTFKPVLSNTTGKTYTVEETAIGKTYSATVASSSLQLVIEPTITSKTGMPVERDVQEVTVNGKPAQKNKNGTFTAQIMLTEEGLHTIPIVTTGYGKSKKVDLKVTYTDTRLAIKNITVTAGGKQQVAAKHANNVYKASVSAKSASFKVELADSSSQVKVTTEAGAAADKNLTFTTKDEVQKRKITVTNGSASREYILEVTYTETADPSWTAALKTLTVKKTGTSEVLPLSPVFGAGNTTYTLDVPHAVDNITVEATAEPYIDITQGVEKTAQEKNTAKAYLLTAGKTVKITVTATVRAEPTKKFTYTIAVTRAKPDASKNANLKALDIKSVWKSIETERFTWNTPFTANTVSYTADTTERAEHLKITATADDPKAKLTLKGASGYAPLTPSALVALDADKTKTTTVVIRVTAEDGKTTKDYTIQVKRLLTSIKLKDFRGTEKDGTAMSDFFKEFREGSSISKSFNASVKAETDQITLTAEAEYPATIKLFIRAFKEENGKWVEHLAKTPFEPPHTVQLPNKETKVELIVESENPALHEYDANIYRLFVTKKDGIEHDARIQQLVMAYLPTAGAETALKLTPDFTPDTKAYTLNLPVGVDKVIANITFVGKKTHIETWGATEYKKEIDVTGKNEIKLVAIAENSNKETYTLTLKRAALAVKINKVEPIVGIGAGAYIGLGDTTVKSKGVTVTGSFEDSGKLIHEIWVGSTAVPIQERLGKKWKKAVVDAAAKTFTVDWPTVTELGNGIRDITAIAYASNNAPIAIDSFAVLIKESTVTQTKNAKLLIKIPDPSVVGITADGLKQYKFVAKVIDAAKQAEFETVVAGETITDGGLGAYGDLPLPLTLQLNNLMVESGTKYFVRLFIHEKRDGKFTPLPGTWNSAEMDINPDGSTQFEIEVK